VFGVAEWSGGRLKGLFAVARVPEITPHETREGEYQVEADYSSVKLPVLPVYRAGAGFEDVGEDGGQDEACRQFDEVMPDMFALEREHAEKFGGNEGGIGEDERQYQKDVHGCGHDGVSFCFQTAFLIQKVV